MRTLNLVWESMLKEIKFEIDRREAEKMMGDNERPLAFTLSRFRKEGCFSKDEVCNAYPANRSVAKIIQMHGRSCTLSR